MTSSLCRLLDFFWNTKILDLAFDLILIFFSGLDIFIGLPDIPEGPVCTYRWIPDIPEGLSVLTGGSLISLKGLSVLTGGYLISLTACLYLQVDP